MLRGNEATGNQEPIFASILKSEEKTNKQQKTTTSTLERILHKAKFIPFEAMFFTLKLCPSYIVGVKIFFHL